MVYEVDLIQLVSQKNTLLREVYQKWKVTSGFMRILEKRHGEYFDTPFWKLPDEIKENVIYGSYENGKQSYCMERLLRNAQERGEDVSEVYVRRVCPECHGESRTAGTKSQAAGQENWRAWTNDINRGA